MKTNHTQLPDAPMIDHVDQSIIVNQNTYTCPILITKTWLVTELDALTPDTWINHPMRLPVQQILSWPEITPNPSLLDLYWQKNIQIELLKIAAACQMTKLSIAENRDYQLVIFPLAF
ncbi:hypothetical protein [Candidatus Synchoanobacter obligatus]|uniref:Uncharacterized protein n=1 Tax=Candidatus Synchoanobacter obligatus TaxID=2919597 RepID=A0ABT1L6X9_9GAMM|nr:hypothetical protein [Candidatus Synchoanobacter obligatus]MCP8352561.1 hypothetical protein [Candidatus Synchoanobacter obligatus]